MHDQDSHDEGVHPFEEGMVGWPNSQEFTELGSESGDGITLVRVTLKMGTPRGAPLDDAGNFNGYKILARIMGPPFRLPKRGARVLVAFPGGDWETPGNAVILGEVGKSPDGTLGRKKTVLDYGDDDVIIAAKSVTLLARSEDDGGTKHIHLVSVSGAGGVQALSDGTGFYTLGGAINLKTVADDGTLKAALVMTQDEASMACYAVPGFTSTAVLTGGGVTLTGQFLSADISDVIKLGVAASPATPVVVGFSGQTGVGSTRVYASP